ncbi:MAG: CDP-diacylglycerol--glycerol-3-phosphate 3-phosphatidyltransferase [Lachnospiraceae bacterium]|nr:CDP-diacylglycerol--glycerol-3-phosphate 3-phosphatidyltransferase [Lachnospiraceae bacterium]
MNLPNRLTILRVLLVPVFVVLLLAGKDSFHMRLAADFVFIMASITDALDGHIARKYNLVTNFGKFMDPLADKLLVCSAMICLVELRQLPGWICILIISREFIISGFRLIAATNGVVIAASYWGKFKTVFQMLMVIAMVANIQNQIWQILTTTLMWISLILTIVSLVDYIVKNKDILKEQS